MLVLQHTDASNFDKTCVRKNLRRYCEFKIPSFKIPTRNGVVSNLLRILFITCRTLSGNLVKFRFSVVSTYNINDVGQRVVIHYNVKVYLIPLEFDRWFWIKISRPPFIVF